MHVIRNKNTSPEDFQVKYCLFRLGGGVIGQKKKGNSNSYTNSRTPPRVFDIS